MTDNPNIVAPEAEPVPFELTDNHKEAICWVLGNCQGITMDESYPYYTLGHMIQAFEAGRLAAAPEASFDPNAGPGEIMMANAIEPPFFVGKTLRDEFAMMVFESALREEDALDIRDGETEREARERFWKDIAEAAYIAADAMMREGVKDPNA